MRERGLASAELLAAGCATIDSRRQGGRDIAQFRDESLGFRDLCKAVMFVEAGCVLVDSVDDDESCGYGLRRCDDSAQCVGEQHAAETLAVKGAVKCEACEEHSRYLPRSSTTDGRRNLVALEEMSSQ
jgi:hypothetical protein